MKKKLFIVNHDDREFKVTVKPYDLDGAKFCIKELTHPSRKYFRYHNVDTKFILHIVSTLETYDTTLEQLCNHIVSIALNDKLQKEKVCNFWD